MKELAKDETIVSCEPVWFQSKTVQPGCRDCGAIAYRELTIKNGPKEVRIVRLCGQHFLEMLRTATAEEKKQMLG